MSIQRSQLAQLLRHAKANVPFYKSRLDPVFRSNGDIDWDRWHEIPIVTRADLRDRRSEMQAASLPPGHGKIMKIYSSGTTGLPVVTSHNHLVRLVSRAAVHRSHRWYNLDWSETFVAWKGDNEEIAGWPAGKEEESWAPRTVPSRLRGKRYFINRFTAAEQALEFIQRTDAKHLSSRPQLLQALALMVEQRGIELKLNSVTTFGTGITDAERNDIERVFGARILSHYSSGEGHKMAISCETGTHFHINSELDFVEILDEANRPCTVGQPGRVVITPLYNTVQPLIRYEQGDIAVRGEPCKCGKALPVLQEISGRLTELFQLPDGRKISPYMPHQVFTENLGVNAWQLVQTAPLAAELRYVHPDPDAIINSAYAEKMIRRQIHKDMRVTFVRLTEMPLTAAGKFIQYKSELYARSAPRSGESNG